MLKNADCTLYEKDSFAKHIITGIYWNDSRGASTQKNGVQIKDNLPVSSDFPYTLDKDYIFDSKPSRALTKFLTTNEINESKFNGTIEEIKNNGGEILSVIRVIY